MTKLTLMLKMTKKMKKMSKKLNLSDSLMMRILVTPQPSQLLLKLGIMQLKNIRNSNKLNTLLLLPLMLKVLWLVTEDSMTF